MSTLPPPDLRARVLAATRQTPSPARAQVTQTTRLLVLLAISSSLAVFFGTGGFQLGNRPVGFVIMTGLGWGILTILAIRVAFVRQRSMLGPSRQVLIALAVLTPATLFVWTVGWLKVWPEAELFDGPWWAYLVCFSLTGTLGLLPLIALAIARRGSDPVHPRATGAALGAAMGAWAGTLIDMHCRCATVPHIAFSHVLPMILLAALGALAAPRILSI